ncbi:hypothetical protein Tco_0506475, partial [Tanacetum coccineum]
LWLLVHGINREQPSRTYVRYTIDTEVVIDTAVVYELLILLDLW